MGRWIVYHEGDLLTTRTIYNHFKDKEDLFHYVLVTSSEGVAAAQIDLVDRHLHKIVDLYEDLVRFCDEWMASRDRFGDDFALVRQVGAEAAFIPPDVLETWQKVGPERALEALAGQLQRIADTGAIRTHDALFTARSLASVLLAIPDDIPPERRLLLVRHSVEMILYGIM